MFKEKTDEWLPSGWMDCTLFIKYLEASVKPSVDNPMLVLLDGHHSHKSIEVIDLARRNNISLIIIPPQTSYRLQPLDFTFFRLLKTSYRCEADK